MTLASLLAGAALLVAGQAAAAPDPLARHRWTSRLVVVVAPSADDQRLAEQRRILERRASGLRERDLVVVEAVGGHADAAAIRLRFGLVGDGFAAILVGKDGEAKLTSDRPIPAADLFAEIDSMPMRRSEMREGQRP